MDIIIKTNKIDAHSQGKEDNPQALNKKSEEV